MSNNDELSEVWVQEEDLSSLSSNELGLNPDRSILNSAVLLQVVQDDIDQRQTDLMENEGRVGEGGILGPCLEGNNIVGENVNIQLNATSTAHVTEFDGDCGHKLSASDRELSATSIQALHSNDPTDSHNFTSSENADAYRLAKYSKETEVGNSELLDTSLSPSTASPHYSLPTTIKGYGLKKWRRFRREIANDATPSLDSSKMLKRGSPNNLDAKQPNEGSVSSTNAFFKSQGHSNQISHPIQSSNHTMDVGATFSAVPDGKDYRNSKSSTAASAPKHRHGLLSATGYHQREKHRVKNVSGRQLNSSDHGFQTGKGCIIADTNKKARGGNINMEKTNSLSSMDSGSRSYGSVLVKGTGSVNSDQLQSDRSANFEEDSYDQQAYEVQSADELQVGHSRNGNPSPECSAELSCNNNTESSKDWLSTECEPLVITILMLQSAQEVLEREIQLFKELGQGINFLCADSVKTNSGSTFAVFSTPGACMDHYSDSQRLDPNHFYLCKNVQTLERHLDEVEVRLKEKSLTVVELETAISSMESCQADARNTLELQHRKYCDMEAELEVLFNQNVEAEVQYVFMTQSTKDLSAIVEDHNQLLREHNTETRKQAQLRRVVANKTAVLQGQGQLDASNKYMIGEEIPKIPKRIVKFISCLFIQLSLLALVFRMLMLELSPESATVVPT